MRRVLLTPRARDDLKGIWRFIAADDPQAADRLLRAIGKRLEQLADFPESGSLRPDIAPAARLLVQGNYLILYEVLADHVEVVAVVHGARNLGKIL